MVTLVLKAVQPVALLILLLGIIKTVMHLSARAENLLWLPEP